MSKVLNSFKTNIVIAFGDIEMTTVKELHSELTEEYNKAFNSGVVSGKIIEQMKTYKGIVPIMSVYSSLNTSGVKCSLVYLHTVLESRFSCFEEAGKTYVDFDAPIGITAWTHE